MQLPTNVNVNKKDVEAFKAEVIKEMKSMGATKEDFEMFPDDLLNDIVATAIVNKQSPHDVAWAVLQ